MIVQINPKSLTAKKLVKMYGHFMNLVGIKNGKAKLRSISQMGGKRWEGWLSMKDADIKPGGY